MPCPPLPACSRDPYWARPPNASNARKDQDVLWLVREVSQQQQQGSASRSPSTLIFTELIIPDSYNRESERNKRERQLVVMTERVRWLRAAGPPYLPPVTSTSTSHRQALDLQMAATMRSWDRILAMTDQPVLWVNPDRCAASRMYRSWVDMFKAVYGL
jgi:hypothetical protein